MHSYTYAGKGLPQKAGKTLEFSAKRYRKKPEFAKALLNRPQMYNKQLEDIKMLEEQGLVYVIAPNQSLGIGRTESNPEIIEKYTNKVSQI